MAAHVGSTAIAFAQAGPAAPRCIGTMGRKLAEQRKALGKLGEPGSLPIVYETGRCGFDLVRKLTTQGYRCEVVAPSRIPGSPGERVNTDRRDALTLIACTDTPRHQTREVLRRGTGQAERKGYRQQSSNDRSRFWRIT